MMNYSIHSLEKACNLVNVFLKECVCVLCLRFKKAVSRETTTATGGQMSLEKHQTQTMEFVKILLPMHDNSSVFSRPCRELWYI